MEIMRPLTFLISNFKDMLVRREQKSSEQGRKIEGKWSQTHVEFMHTPTSIPEEDAKPNTYIFKYILL